jgi:hypothetical protein
MAPVGSPASGHSGTPRMRRHACTPGAHAALKMARAPYQTLSGERRPTACLGRAVHACSGERSDAYDTLI